MHRTWAIFKKSFYSWTRLPVALFFTFVFPLLFLVVFALAFRQGTYSPEPTFRIAVWNEDVGVPQDFKLPEARGRNLGNLLVDLLRHLRYPETQKPMFHVVEISDTTDIARALQRGTYDLFMEIPETFSQQAWKYIWIRATSKAKLPMSEEGREFVPEVRVYLRGVAGTLEYSIGARVVRGVITGFLQGMADSLSRHLASGTRLPEEPRIEVVARSITPSDLTVFDYIVAGYFLFNVLMLIIGFTQSLVQEREAGFWDLFRLTRLRPHEYLMGESGVFLGIGWLQMIFFYLIARFLGFHHHGSVLHLVLPMTLGFISAMGLGFLLAALITHQKTASAVANTVGLVLGFIALSGSGFPIPNPSLLHLKGAAFGILDFFPWRHAAIILKTTFVQGLPLTSVLPSLWILLGETLAVLLLSLWVFHKRVLSRGG